MGDPIQEYKERAEKLLREKNELEKKLKREAAERKAQERAHRPRHARK